jgi:transposase-like protein
MANEGAVQVASLMQKRKGGHNLRYVCPRCGYFHKILIDAGLIKPAVQSVFCTGCKTTFLIRILSPSDYVRAELRKGTISHQTTMDTNLSHRDDPGR